MKNKCIVQIANFAAPYKGNFIESLVELEEELKNDNNRVIYIFPESCQNTNWINDFKQSHTVYFVSSIIQKYNLFYNKELIKQLSHIFDNEKVDIIHSHFDGYDVPVVIASKKSNIKIIWHYHNPREYVSSAIKRIYQKIQFFLQYCYFGKGVKIIAVSDSCLPLIKSHGFNMDNVVTIYNGVSEKRIDTSAISKKTENNKYTFLCFGGRGNHKGIDVLLKAVKLLKDDNVEFNVTLVEGQDTKQFMIEEFGSLDNVINEIKIIRPSDDINSLFEKSDCFISCSRRETFSYAVHEAVLYGLPVISSDIPALKRVNKLSTVIQFENENHLELYKAMLCMIDKSYINEDELVKSREYVIQNFTVRVWVDKVIKFYDSII